MLRALVLASLVAFLAAPSRADDRHRAAPTGFVVVPDEDEDPLEKPSANPDAEPAKAKAKKKREPDAAAWTEPAPKKGLTIVEEGAAASTVIRAGDLEADRAGKPFLGGKKGIGFVQPVAPVGRQGSFTFKASAADAKEEVDDDDDDDDDDAPARAVRAPPKAAARAAPRAPSGLMTPTDDDDAPAPRGRRADDPFDDAHAPTPAPQQAPARDDDASAMTAPARNMLPTGRQVGPGGGAIKVEEVHIDYQQDSFIDVGRRKPEVKAPKPKPEPAPKPAPARRGLLMGDDEDAPAKAAVEEPERPARPPAESRRPIVTAPPADDPPPPRPEATEPPAPKDAPRPADDPFDKLNRELRQLDPKTEAGPLDEPVKQRRPPEQKVEIPAEPEMAVKPIDVPPPSENPRDPSMLGLSVTAGLGAALADDPSSGYAADFAYGAGVMLNPSFAGPFALDLSFFRAARTGGTPFISVDSAWNHVAARLLYVKEQKGGVFLGFGAGVLVTANSATYHVNDGHATDATGAQPRLGGDGSVVAGIRFRPLELRLDLRALLRGGFRLDFLPTFSVGVSF